MGSFKGAYAYSDKPWYVQDKPSAPPDLSRPLRRSYHCSLCGQVVSKAVYQLGGLGYCVECRQARQQHFKKVLRKQQPTVQRIIPDASVQLRRK